MNTKNFTRTFASIARRMLLSVLVTLILLGSLPAVEAYAWSYTGSQSRMERACAITLCGADLLEPTGKRYP